MVAEGLVLVGEGARGKQRIVLGKIVLQPQRQGHHVPRGRHLLVVGQARRHCGRSWRSCRAGAPSASSAGRTCSSLPAMCSATATATSLALLVISALMASMSAISSPSLEIELGGGRRRGVGGNLDLGLVAEPALLDQLEGEVDASSSWPARPGGGARRRRSGAGRGRCWRRSPARRSCSARRGQRPPRQRQWPPKSQPEPQCQRQAMAYGIDPERPFPLRPTPASCPRTPGARARCRRDGQHRFGASLRHLQASGASLQV